MKKEEIRRLVISGIEEIQRNSGRPIEEITDDTCPIGDVAGFDSLNCLELGVILSRDLPGLKDGFRPCVTDDNRPLELQHIIERVGEALATEGDESNE